MHKQPHEEATLSKSFKKKDIEAIIKLLKNRYKIPRYYFQAFSGPGEKFETTLVKNEKVFRFDRAFPFTIGETDGPNGPKFRKLLIENLQKMLEEL